MNMKELKERAVKVEDQMEVYWPQFSSHEVIDLRALKPEEKKMQYSYNNSVIAFVDENGDMYVIPDIGIQNTIIKRTNGNARITENSLRRICLP